LNNRVAAAPGVGPGLGAAVVRRFARESFAVALMARNEDGLSEIRWEIEDGGGTALPISADATDPASVEAAFGRVRDEIGDLEVFVYNAGAFQMGGILEIPLDRFDDCFKANCAGELCTPLTNVSSIWAGSGGPKR
jgi:NAD(P)-dependent dehydrogenase (short-subunit alcohol dehydrogenase family)